MIRTFLAEGDKAGNAVIIEGLPNCLHKEENGSNVRLATVGMSTYCHACRKTGSIAASGPRRLGTAWNGKDWALSGDINICDCDPAPVFSAQRNMTMLLTSEEIARSSVPYGRAVPASSVPRAVPEHGNLPGDMSSVTMPNSGVQRDCSYLDGTKNRIDAPADFYKRTNKERMPISFPSNPMVPGTSSWNPPLPRHIGNIRPSIRGPNHRSLRSRPVQNRSNRSPSLLRNPALFFSITTRLRGKLG